MCLHQLNFKNNNGPICYLRIYLGIETDSFWYYVATDRKDGHGLKLEESLANRCKLKLFPVVHWSDRVARIDIMDWSWKTSGQPSTVFKFLCCACKMATIFCLVLFDKSIWHVHHDSTAKFCAWVKAEKFIDLIHDAHHLCTFSRISRLCFDSPHPLTFVLQDSCGLMGGIKTKSTATPLPPQPFFSPRPCLAHFVINFHFCPLGGLFAGQRKGKENTPFLGTRLSLRGGGRGFPPATMHVAPGYFHGKTEEK